MTNIWQAGIPRKITNFIVYKSFKGDVPNYISIFGSLSSSNIKYYNDSLYLVFASRVEPWAFLDPNSCTDIIKYKYYYNSKYYKMYWTDDCSFTKLLSESSETLSKLGQPKLHKPEEDRELKFMLTRRQQQQNEIDNQNALFNEKLQEQRQLTDFYKTAFIISIFLLTMIIVSLIILKIKNAT